MNTQNQTPSVTASESFTRSATALRIGALSLGLITMSLLYPLNGHAQGSAARPAGPEEATTAAVTLMEASAKTIAPLLMNSNHLGRDAMNRYPGWIDWRNPRQAEILLQVNEEGRVQSVRLSKSSGHPLVDRALQEVARDMRFAPATLDGASVGVWVRVPVKMEGGS
ncbi:MAG: energy transducer TonB [Gemmatimonadetes bacterium]|nr:energy transducer TonB [Gemmatimonadota bacterium]